jgi:chromosome partitioning protein
LKLVNDVGKPFVFVITQAKANTRLTLQTMAALSEHGPVASSILGDRVDYASALIDGRTALETARSGIAAQEVMNLWAGLKERLSENAKGRNSTKGVKHG